MLNLCCCNTAQFAADTTATAAHITFQPNLWSSIHLWTQVQIQVSTVYIQSAYLCSHNKSVGLFNYHNIYIFVIHRGFFLSFGAKHLSASW